MIKEKLKEIIDAAVACSIKDGKLGSLSQCPVPVIIEHPRLEEHGDFACGVALKLAGRARMSPMVIAETLAWYITHNMAAGPEYIAQLNVAAPGFINFHLGKGWLKDVLKQIHNEGDAYGRLEIGAGKSVLLEYVSANPTGQLHIGHGRNAVFGSCLANLLKFAGYKVDQEFYLNDTGEQIAQLAMCAWCIYQKRFGLSVDYPDSGYPEDSIEEYVGRVIEKHQDRFLHLPAEQAMDKVGEETKKIILQEQKELLQEAGIHFDSWFSEVSLHTSGKVDVVLNTYANNQASYEAEGATWLKSKELGDERDRVLRKSTGHTTYLAADAAYHLNKYERGYDRYINIWGADHHGQVPGLRAAIKALGKDPDWLEIVLTQIVNLSRDGQIVRMSKRRGTVVTLAEVMDEVGVDAVRYYLAESNPQNPINFDLELSKQSSRENPAFYIQYAHARCCAILRRALDPIVNPETRNTEPPLIRADEWSRITQEYNTSTDVFSAAFDSDPDIFAHQKALVLCLASLKEEVFEAANTRLPGRLARYAFDVANALQKFYEVSRVITDDPAATKARLGLIMSTRQVLANVLGIIGVSAPQRM